MRHAARPTSAADDLALAADADLVVLAAPVAQNIAMLPRPAAHVSRRRAIVTDVGSTKRDIVAAARALPPRLRFVGGHPLAGAAAGGVEAARADLFDGRPWILTPSAECDAADVERVERAWRRAVGALPSHDGRRRARPPGRLPQPPAAAHGQRADARRRERAGPTGSAWPAAACGTRRGWRRARRTSGATSRRPTRTTLGRAIDELIAVLQRLKADLDALATTCSGPSTPPRQWKRTLDESESSGRGES